MGQNPITFSPDFEKEHYTLEFLGLFENSLDVGIVTYEGFDGGYSLFRIQISPGVRKAYNMNLNKSQTRLVIRFSMDLPHNVTVVTHGKHFS